MLGSWRRQAGAGRAQGVLGRLRPEAPLKGRMDAARAGLESQIARLDQIQAQFRESERAMFARVVEAQRRNDGAHAAVYASELAVMRRRNRMVENAKNAMEGVHARLETMSGLGDVVVTLSPCMSIIKGINASVGGMLPDAEASMRELRGVLGEMLSSETSVPEAPPAAGASPDAEAILGEAQAAIVGEARRRLPAPPSEAIKRDIVGGAYA